MIIDFHTHAFPEAMAEQTLIKLSKTSGVPYYLDGTIRSLLDSMHKSGIDYSVILPIVTRPSQHTTINRTAIEVNEHWNSDGIISFGSVHPDNKDYRDIIKHLAANGVKGIKLHPVFQGIYFDDIRYKRIIDCACEYNLIIVVHGGYDISFPNADFVTTEHIIPVLKDIRPEKMILAHMGSWLEWDKIAELLDEYRIMMDTAFTLTSTPPLSNELFTKLVDKAGAENIFFGTDSPWTTQPDSINAVMNSGLTKGELSLIMSGNARRLLKL